jgi:hypothetical protein
MKLTVRDKRVLMFAVFFTRTFMKNDVISCWSNVPTDEEMDDLEHRLASAINHDNRRGK